jgi:hypothetical protein
MSDIENPPPSGSAGDASSGVDPATAMAPEPSRHAFWAWKERLVTAYLAGNNPQPDDDDDQVGTTVDADQRSRYNFVHFWAVLGLVVLVGFTLLLVLPSPSTVGSAGFFATRVVAIIGIVVAFCCAGFFIVLAQSMDDGDTSVHRVIDFLM